MTNPVLNVTSGSAAIFQLNGTTVFSRGGGDLGGRGLNIAILDEKTGNRIKEYQHFDSWWYQNDAAYKQSIANYLNAIPNGSIVMIAVVDNSGLFNYTIDQPIYLALEAMGSTQIQTAPQTSWAMITVKGTGKLAETSTTNSITATNYLTVDRNAEDAIRLFKRSVLFFKESNKRMEISMSTFRVRMRLFIVSIIAMI